MLAFALSLSAADRRVAITIDDLPRGGDSGPRTLPAIRAMTTRLLAPFRDQHIPVIGFVNASREIESSPDGLRSILGLWLDAGAELGNHSYSHLNVNQVSFDEYAEDIVKVSRSSARSWARVERVWSFTGTRSSSPARRRRSSNPSSSFYRPIALSRGRAHHHRQRRLPVCPCLHESGASGPRQARVPPVPGFRRRILRAALRGGCRTGSRADASIHASQMNANSDARPFGDVAAARLRVRLARSGARRSRVRASRQLRRREGHLVDSPLGGDQGHASKDEPDSPKWVRDVFAARKR